MAPQLRDLAGPVLDGGAHAAGSDPVFAWWYVAASVAIVGGVGGLLYWYYGERVGRA